LEFPNCTYSSDEPVHDLLDSIASLAKLTTLCLDFDINLPELQLAKLATTLKQLPQLTSLTLSFEGSNNFDYTSLRLIVQSLASLAHLNYLDLNLGRCSALNKLAITEFIQALAGFKLTSLTLNLRNMHNFTNEHLIMLAQAISNLRALSIDITRCWNPYTIGITALTTEIGNLKLLSALTLKLDGTSITDDTMHQLAEAFDQLNNLTKLDLDIFDCVRITAKGVDYLINSLEKLPQLAELALNLPRNGCADPESIKKLHALIEAKQLHVSGIIDPLPISF
jgi:hypothetical protein